MESILHNGSSKIKKKTRNTKHGERNFLCGCNKAYKSYPALYLHIKRKHEGIKPENTISTKTIDPVKKARTHTGRPHKVILFDILCFITHILANTRYR